MNWRRIWAMLIPPRLDLPDSPDRLRQENANANEDAVTQARRVVNTIHARPLPLLRDFEAMERMLNRRRGH